MARRRGGDARGDGGDRGALAPVWAALEDLDGVELLLVNAHHVKNLPGRKTDVNDAVWLAQLLECGLLRGSFVAPPVIARLRDLTRYRKKVIEDRAREVQRVQKALEMAGVKLDSVVSDVMGKAARRMLDALALSLVWPLPEIRARLSMSPSRRSSSCRCLATSHFRSWGNRTPGLRSALLLIRGHVTRQGERVEDYRASRRRLILHH